MSIAPSPRVVSQADTDRSYVDWPAIFAGAVLAVAISFVLITFGSGIGLSMVSPEAGEGVSMRWVTIAAGIWFIWVAVSSFAAGGYLAGRMRRPSGDASSAGEVETRDGAHGVIVWAVGAMIGMVLAASGVTGVIGGAASIAGTTATTAASAMEDEMDYYTGLFLRSDTGTVADAPEVRDEIASVLTRSLAQGELTEADRSHLSQVIANAMGMDVATAQARVDDVMQQAEAARQTAIDAIDEARTVGIIASFLIAATLLVSAAGAYFAATIGGQHRDNNIAFRTFGR